MGEKKKGLIIFLTSILFIILIALIIVLAISTKKTPMGNQEKQENQGTQTGKVQDVENDLNYSFLKLENTQKNNIYSPLSIKYALKMVEEGASGETKKQIENLTNGIELTKYDSIDKVLSLANCAYIRNTYKQYVRPEFTSRILSNYNAEINYDDFNDAKNINKWIEEKTLGIIKNMLSDDIVQDPNTEMLLINALAIDMEWAGDFNGEDTKGQDFTLADGSKIEASMMKREALSSNVGYYIDDDVTAITMDLKQYDNTQLEFTAIMPNSTLSDYVKSFSQSNLDNISKNTILASETKDGVVVRIPRFSFEYDLELKNDLMQLGMTDAFSDVKADFANMTSEKAGLYISDALHKAHIDLSEKGVKAAAVTVMTFSVKSTIFEQKQPIEITIDKPFLFIIKDKNTGEVWFVGTVYKPELWRDALIQ